MTRVIGLISGTSADGIDVALTELSGRQADLNVELIAGATYPYPADLHQQILAVINGATLTMAELAALDEAIAQEFAKAALTIQDKYGKAELIGSHGQTVYHRPPQAQQLGYSLQLGRGELIAHLLGTKTVSNFRAADLAAGGQGAPLVSIVDACFLSHPQYHRCIQNLGGIGNVTYLPKQEKAQESQRAGVQPASWSGIMGWDTGPGNCLLDLAVHRLSQGTQNYDAEGAWAAKGTPCQALVEQWLQHDFFQQSPPKSTGRELFSQEYLDACFVDAQRYNLDPADILATLTELTVASIVQSYRSFLPQMPDQVLLGGGGSHNLYLKHRLQAALAPASVLTTSEVGLNSDFKEAITFAILAYWRDLEIPGNLPQVTGAQAPVLLGEIHSPVESGAW